MNIASCKLQSLRGLYFSLDKFVTLRGYATRKRFYKNVNILFNDNKYEITLDHRKLKTPNKQPLVLKSEPLAVAVATEWSNQKENIQTSSMHMTSLCNTAIDNPNKLEKIDIVNYILSFITTDTILYQSEDEKQLYELQSKEWDPLIEWFNTRYEMQIEKTLGLLSPKLLDTNKMNISKYLMSHNIEALHGFVFAVDTLKSVILAFGAIDQYLTIEKAVYLSRLEAEYQLKFWGRVEWSHDLEKLDLQARLAAAVLFIHFNRSEYFLKEKSII